MTIEVPLFVLIQESPKWEVFFYIISEDVMKLKVDCAAFLPQTALLAVYNTDSSLSSSNM